MAMLTLTCNHNTNNFAHKCTSYRNVNTVGFILGVSLLKLNSVRNHVWALILSLIPPLRNLLN